MPQLMAACGICAGYFTCYGTIHVESSLSWRTPFIIQAVLGSILAMSCLYLPTSPRWLLLHHRREEALAALERLDIPQAEAEKDILRPVAPGPHRKLSAGDFLTIFHKQYRGQTMLGLFILGMIQLCGIDGVLYVSSMKAWSSHHLIQFSSMRLPYSLKQDYQVTLHPSWHPVSQLS